MKRGRLKTVLEYFLQNDRTFLIISILRGKRESEKSWRNQEGNRKNWSEKQGRQGLERKNAAIRPYDLSSNPCRPCFSERAAGDCAGIETHVSRQSSGCSCGHPRQSSNDCKEFETAAGGGLGSKGSWAFERGLSRCCRIRSTTRGSVIKDRMRIHPPHGQSRGSVSKIFLINRAHVLRASLKQSESSCAGMIAAGKAALSPSAGSRRIQPRLEYAP